MDNIVEGRIIQKLDIESGQSARGPWQKQNFIIETTDTQFPRKICIGLWTNQIQTLQSYQIGDMIRAYINIESREFNGRWYTDIRAWKLENPATTPMPQPAMPYGQPMPQQGMPYTQPMAQPGMPYAQPGQPMMQQPMQQPQYQQPQYQQPQPAQQPTFNAPDANLPEDGSDLPF